MADQKPVVVNNSGPKIVDQRSELRSNTLKQFIVANDSEIALTVPVENENTKDEVFIMPRSKAKLAKGFVVSPQWLRSRPFIIQTEV